MQSVTHSRTVPFRAGSLKKEPHHRLHKDDEISCKNPQYNWWYCIAIMVILYFISRNPHVSPRPPSTQRVVDFYDGISHIGGNIAQAFS
jgi:hypothetical protein